MSRTSITTLSLILLALLPLSSCEEEPCNACKAADCPERPLNGAYALWLQISRDDCGLSWSDGQAVLYVIQDLMNEGEDNEWTQLTMTMTKGLNPVSVQGELCQTEDTEYPKSYRFSASHSSGPIEEREDTSLGGEFIIGDADENFCASMSVVQTFRDDEGTYESCSMSAAVYTNDECCNNKEKCR